MCADVPNLKTLTSLGNTRAYEIWKLWERDPPPTDQLEDAPTPVSTSRESVERLLGEHFPDNTAAIGRFFSLYEGHEVASSVVETAPTTIATVTSTPIAFPPAVVETALTTVATPTVTSTPTAFSPAVVETAPITTENSSDELGLTFPREYSAYLPFSAPSAIPIESPSQGIYNDEDEG